LRWWWWWELCAVALWALLLAARVLVGAVRGLLGGGTCCVLPDTAREGLLRPLCKQLLVLFIHSFIDIHCAARGARGWRAGGAEVGVLVDDLSLCV
jgi:hypothetical protein